MPNVASISQQIWDMKYRLRSANGQAVDDTIEDSWRRVADAVAAAEACRWRLDAGRWQALRK